MTKKNITKNYLQQVYLRSNIPVVESSVSKCDFLRGCLGYFNSYNKDLKIYIRNYLANKHKLCIFYHEYGHYLTYLHNGCDDNVFEDILSSEFDAQIYAGEQLLQTEAWTSLQIWAEMVYNWLTGNDDHEELSTIAENIISHDLWLKIAIATESSEMIDSYEFFKKS